MPYPSIGRHFGADFGRPHRKCSAPAPKSTACPAGSLWHRYTRRPTTYIIRWPVLLSFLDARKLQTRQEHTPGMEQVPTAMRALVAPKPCRPDGYEIAQLPVPEITEPSQVLIRMHAAAIQTGDCQFASGSARMFLSIRSVAKHLPLNMYQHRMRAEQLMPPTHPTGLP